jgi:hypothetical protein
MKRSFPFDNMDLFKCNIQEIITIVSSTNKGMIRNNLIDSIPLEVIKLHYKNEELLELIDSCTDDDIIKNKYKIMIDTAIEELNTEKNYPKVVRK